MEMKKGEKKMKMKKSQSSWPGGLTWKGRVISLLKDRNNQKTRPCRQCPSLASLARGIADMGESLENCCSSAN